MGWILCAPAVYHGWNRSAEEYKNCYFSRDDHTYESENIAKIPNAGVVSGVAGFKVHDAANSVPSATRPSRPNHQTHHHEKTPTHPPVGVSEQDNPTINAPTVPARHE